MVEWTNKAEKKRKNRVRQRRVLVRDTVERAVKTDIDIRTESKGVGMFEWFMSKT